MADAISNRKTFGVIMFWDTTVNKKLSAALTYPYLSRIALK